MICLSTSSLGLSFGADVILEGVSFAVNDGDRVGIIGVNGAGKTSLFRLITGEYAPTEGNVFIQKGHRIGCLEQNPDLSALPGDFSCLEYMYTAFGELLSLEEDILRLEEEIGRLSEMGDHAEAVRRTEELTAKNNKLATEGGMEFRSRCRSMLLRLGFDEEMLTRRISTLSGGQYTRLALARLLATEPDLLMLDEPTNHLDIDSIGWLESFLSTYKKTVLIISHDRYFLDRTTNKTLLILNKHATLYNGNYSRSREQREAEAASLEKRYKEQQKEIARIKANIEFQRRCNREHNFVTIRSKEKQLARMERIELAPKDPKDIKFAFTSEEDSAGDVIVAKELSFSYGSEPLIKGLSFIVRRYERLLILGKNGCGKSTLMKLLNSLITPTEGKVTLGYNIKIGYYDQENRGLDPRNTVFMEMRGEYPTKTDLELRSCLAQFHFGADDILKPVSALSGGERARLTLAKLMLKSVNLLIMDEPTNHLDIGSAEALENALLAFDGTIVAVSHDRYFINKVATRIIELDASLPGGGIDYLLEESDDAYGEYLRLRERAAEARAGADLEKEKEKTSAKEDYERKKQENAKRRGDERRIAKAKERISELEALLERLEEELFGEAATDYLRAAAIEEEKQRAEEELMELYELVM